jgi:N-acetylneuraminic acid mutarotase
MGGFRATYVALYDILQEYDPVENKWSTKAKMPTARYSLSSSVVDGKIYAIGGLVGEEGEYEPTSAVEVYDPVTDTWTKKKSMPTARYGLATCVVGGRIYAIGGFDASQLPIATVEEYDPVSDSWTRKADMITPRYYLAADAISGQIYAAGGYDVTNIPIATVELYVPGRDIWMEVRSMPTPRRGLSAIAADGKIYAIGGYGMGDQDLSVVEEYTPESWNFAVTPLDKLAATWGNIKQSW